MATKKIAKSDCINHQNGTCLFLGSACPLGGTCGIYDPPTNKRSKTPAERLDKRLVRKIQNTKQMIAKNVSIRNMGEAERLQYYLNALIDARKDLSEVC